MKIAVAAEAYLAHLQAEGKSPSTCGTAKRTLALLVAHLGAEREAGEVAAEDLRGFFASEAATKQRGKPRAAASVAQVQGIVRAALAWWNQQGHAERQEPAKTPAPASRAIQPPAPTAAPVAAPAPATKPAPATQPPAPAAPPVAAPALTRAPYLDLSYQGQPVRFAKTEIDRNRLYGLRKLVAIDAQGRECESALLTRDGRYVLRPGSTADLYINEYGDTVARHDLVQVDEAGAPLLTSAPTAYEPKEIIGPLAAADILDYAAIRVHALQPVAVPAKLAQALAAGALFRVPYRTRLSVVGTPAFLLGTDAGAFLIQVEPHGFDFVGPDQPVLPAEDPDEDDLDAFAFPDSFGAHHDP
ncbi:MAG: hypothetical protein WCE40_08155 [Polyangia bacterium]